MATWTQGDLDGIRAAIASGELEVEYTDKRVRYRSMDDLMKALSIIERVVEGESGASMAGRQRRFITARGTQ